MKPAKGRGVDWCCQGAHPVCVVEIGNTHHSALILRKKMAFFAPGLNCDAGVISGAVKDSGWVHI